MYNSVQRDLKFYHIFRMLESEKNYNLHLAHGRENNVSNPSDFADLEKEDSAKIERDDPVVEPLVDLQLHTI